MGYVGYIQPVRERGRKRRAGNIHLFHTVDLVELPDDRKCQKAGRGGGGPQKGMVSVVPGSSAFHPHRRLLWDQLLRSEKVHVVFAVRDHHCRRGSHPGDKDRDGRTARVQSPQTQASSRDARSAGTSPGSQNQLTVAEADAMNASTLLVLPDGCLDTIDK